ncbi:MAG: methionine biosynthesis protein MetW [Pseudomonadota bacterium]
MKPIQPGVMREDFRVIADIVPAGSRLLDIGCGDGSLLSLLITSKNVDARGIELSQTGVNQCVARGLFVIQGDADTDLDTYPDRAFDYVVLSQTIQATRQPKAVLENLLRIGERAIVSFPNFGHWRNRLQFGLTGQMPVTEALPDTWYDTPNIHFCTIRDFIHLVENVGAKTERLETFFADGRHKSSGGPVPWLNLFAGQAMFVLRKD